MPCLSNGALSVCVALSGSYSCYHRVMPRTGARSAQPPVWIFGLLNTTNGATTGFAVVAATFLLRKYGVPVDRIAAIVGIVIAISMLYALWSPLLDLILSRRTWVLVMSISSAILLFTASLIPLPRHLTWFTAAMAAANAIGTSLNTPIGGLMAVLLPDSQRGRAGGWFQAGNIGGSALMGGLCIWLADRLSSSSVGLIGAAALMIPCLGLLAIREPARDVTPTLERFREVFLQIHASLRCRKTQFCLALFLSPMGVGAAMNLFPAIGVDYHASAATVAWVSGFGAGLATALGCIAGGYVCDRMDRWNAYLLFALLCAIPTTAMIAAPMRPVTFVVGASAYILVVGFCYAAYGALVLQTVGDEPSAAGTRMSLLSSASIAPIAYVTWLDGQGYRTGGVTGLLATDVICNVLPVLPFGVLLLWIRQRPPKAIS